MTLTVREAAASYERAMRDVAAAGPGVCEICHTFVDPAWSRCYACNNQPAMLDAVGAEPPAPLDAATRAL